MTKPFRANHFALENSEIVFGFEVPMAVIMNSTVFSDVTPCNPVEVHIRFGENTVSIFWVEEYGKKAMLKILSKKFRGPKILRRYPKKILTVEHPCSLHFAFIGHL
jgi:hypothetical protein